MKYLLLLAFLAAIWWVWNKRRSEVPDERQASPPVDNMLVCAHCGVHFPERDGLKEDGQAYCCEAHRLAARSAGR